MSLSNLFYEPVYTVSDFNRLFDEAFSARNSPTNGHHQQVQRQSDTFLRPRMDVHENTEANAVTATFELPGLRKEDVNIDVHDGRLTISGESKIDETREEHGYAVRERRFGRFSRSLQLPRGVKDDEIKAAMENGLLTVTFPKTGSEAAPKRITIS